MWQRKCGGLQQRSGGHSHAATEDGPSSAKWVTDKDSQDGTEKAAQIVRGNRNALVQAALRSGGCINGRIGGIDIGEVFDK
jgi:hypothetical protein